MIKFVTEHPNKHTYAQLSDKFKRSHNAIRGIIGRARLNHLVVKELGGTRSFTKETKMVKKTSKELTAEARLESQLRHQANTHKDLDKKYKSLQDDLHKTKVALDNALGIRDHKPQISKIQVSKVTRGGATVVACLSDVHCEELVPLHKTNGLNEHNPDISKRRVHKFFELLVRFIRVDRHETDINNLVLWLGGDFFSSDGHGVPTAFPPMIAAMYAQDMIASGLAFLRTNEPKLHITVVGSVGNHSRKDMMKPVNVAIEQELSLEWMMYHALKARYESDMVKFVLEPAYNTYLQVENKMLRFNHGHLGWRYNDGLAGVHGPLWKWVTQKADKQIRADLTICGHYHSYTPSSLSRGYALNGSTIGTTPYGMAFGQEPPAQMYFLVHSKYGIVGQRPLFVDV